MAWLTDWTYRKKIAIQHANVDALLGDFPLYVGFCDDADLAGALATGYDVRFTQSDGETLLAYERESWSGGGANVTADFWVKVPSISAVAGTDIYVYWGKAGAADGQDAANAWNSSHLMVLHLNGNVLDSTGNGNDCTNYGTSSAPAAVSDGRSFDGSNDWIQTPLSVNYKTFSMWFQCDGWTSQRTPASHDESGSYAEDWTLYNYYTDSRLVLRCTSTFRTVLNPVGTGWYYITIAADGTNWRRLSSTREAGAHPPANRGLRRDRLQGFTPAMSSRRQSCGRRPSAAASRFAVCCRVAEAVVGVVGRNRAAEAAIVVIVSGGARGVERDVLRLAGVERGHSRIPVPPLVALAAVETNAAVELIRQGLEAVISGCGPRGLQPAGA